MNTEELYKQWTERHRDDLDGFTDCQDAVMRAIAGTAPDPKPRRLTDRLRAWPAQCGDRLAWVCAAAMAVTGVYRVCAITMNLLVP